MNEQDLPIDIHYNKLLEWLINRRHCQQQWQSKALTIRELINTAIQDMPDIPEITQLLKGSYLNYFHCLRIVEILSSTDDGSKNIFGQYSSQRMKDWVEILRSYEADGVYLAESAQVLTRNVNYEIPALKKQITKCQQTHQECVRKETDYKSHAAEKQEKYKLLCQQMGIEGKKIKRELISLVEDLPVTCDEIARKLSSVEEACVYYTAFISFTLARDEDCVPLLKYLVKEGNTTVYQYHTGEVPTRIEKPVLDYGLEEEGNETQDGSGEIDWGEADIDFNVTSEEVDGQIDWGGDNIDIEIVDDSTQNTEAISEETGVARGDEALSLLGNSETRGMFIDELMELQAFLSHRVSEIRTDTSVLSSAQFHNAPTSIQVDVVTVKNMLSKVNSLLSEVTSKRMKELFLIYSSPRYVHRLAESLQKVMQESDRAISLSRLMVARQQEAREEQGATEPKVDILRSKTQELKKQIEKEISKKYKNRRVNLMGEINTV